MCLGQPFAKSFSLYGERVGAFISCYQRMYPRLVLIASFCVWLEISSCPLYGSRIVETVLSNLKLREMWINDLKTMSNRIKNVRSSPRRKPETLTGSGDWRHTESQIGMFSYSGLTEEQVKLLAERHHIYMMQSGRASLSGVNDGNVKYVAQAFNEVLTHSQ